MNQPAAETCRRFSRDIAAAAGREVDPGEWLGVAVSGGPDSLALLLLTHTAMPGRVAAATVDHGLRPEAAAEARHVAAICARMGVPHQVLPISWDANPRANLQAQARARRYTVLGRWAQGRGLALVATAHHLDDQAETILMRMLRGAGVGGLRGIRPHRPLLEDHPSGPALVRPLLGWRRAELAALVTAAGIAPIDDPSNRDPRFDRSRVRPLLAATGDRLVTRIAAFAAPASEADEALDWVAQRLWAERVTPVPGGLELAAGDLPPELSRRLVLRVLAAVDPAPAPRGAKLARFIAALAGGETATIGRVLGHGGSCWRFTLAPLRRTG